VRIAPALAVAASLLTQPGVTGSAPHVAQVDGSATRATPDDLFADFHEDEARLSKSDIHPRIDPVATPTDPSTPSLEHGYGVWEAADCVTLAGADPHLDTWCTGPHDIALYEIACPTGTVFTWPLKTRTRPTGTARWSPWRLLNSPCQPPPEDTTTGTTDPVAAELAHQLATLPIPPKHARIAPVTTWFTVQTPMTYYTDAAPETLTTTVLGTTVTLELTPTEFTWDPGDGTAPLRTTRPGAPYPDQTTTHTYTRLGTYQVTLTTTWHGRYRTPDDTTWHDIPGTGTTTHTTDPFTTHEIRSVLTG